MHTLNLIVLIIHLASGAAALVAAAIAVGTKKGAQAHRRWGRMFGIAMVLIFLTAFTLLALPPTPASGRVFLGLIALFSVWLALTGWVRARNRAEPTRAEWALALAMLAVFPLMFGAGAWMLSAGATLGWVLLVFGGIALALGGNEVLGLKRGRFVGKRRIASHLTYMLAGTIATLTAFSVTALQGVPPLVAWLGPSVLISPVISVWNTRVLKGGEAAV